MIQVRLVIPCYNEERRLDADVFLDFSERNPSVRFLLVDDGSTDGTRRVLEEMAQSRPESFQVLAFDRNRGKAEAVRTGILQALEGREDAIGFWDADLATPLDAIPGFIAVLHERREVELVLGSRVRLLGRTVERDPRRHYFGRLAATVVSAMLGLPVYDTQCGAKLFRRTEQLRTLFAEPFVTKWAFDVEILARWLAQEGSRQRAHHAIVELPVQEWRDVSGSKLRARDFALAPIDLWRIRQHYPKLRSAHASLRGPHAR